MCGIYVTNLPIKEEEVKNRIETVKYRGPDYTGITKKKDLLLGHLRLSILDLEERSNQPMTYKNFTIVFNGEIYNFEDVKKELVALGYSFSTTGDTEVILKAYAEWGSNMMPKLNGMFAFAIYDENKNTLFCSRDRLGVKPFYYYWKDGVLEICSQLRPISQEKTLNEKAVSIFLDCTYIPSPFSIFNDVYKLPPGNNLFINFNNQEIKIESYWDLTKVKVDTEISYEEAIKKVHNLLTDAVKIRLQSDVPFGSFLSGGIDSALVTSIATKVSKEKIKTFSIGFSEPKFDESKVAKKYSQILETQHTETICSAQDVLDMLPKLIEVYDEPFADSSALPSLLLNKVTKKHVTVALSGDGGDESFLGYNHFDLHSKIDKLTIVPYELRKRLSFVIPKIERFKSFQKLKRILKVKDKYRFIEGVFLGYNSLLKDRDFRWLDTHYKDYRLKSLNTIQKIADLGIKLWLDNDSNAKVDRASMAYSVEVRSPFLDYRVIELARTLPIEYRYQKGRKKRILRDILKNYISEEVFNQPKKGFSIPLASWIRGELKNEFINTLNDDFLNSVPNLNVKKFKIMFTQHLKGSHDNSSYIWRVFILAKWYKEFGY